MQLAEQSVRSMREQIVDTLRAEVLAGAWTNHAPVREQALAERFGVSRGPIRDALQELSREGVLVYRPNKGVRVNTPPAEACLLYTSPSPRDGLLSRMPSSA